MKWLKIFILLTILFIFFYSRIAPIVNQTVPYTYDQGRDFLRAEEILREKKLVFLGPTTGIMGVYHGVWWYYLLAAFYLIFNGMPSGFYIGLFILSSAAIFLFAYFIHKKFDFFSLIFFLIIVSASEFFVRLAFFVSNNTFAPLFVLLYLFALYKYTVEGKKFYLLLIGLALGFIFEFEVAFGIFFITSFILASIFFSKFRNIFTKIDSLKLILTGIVIPTLPRILFELKNNFIQTNSLLSFFKDPTSTNKISYKTAFLERVNLFFNYFVKMFPSELLILAIITILLLCLFIIKGQKEIFSKKSSLIYFLSFQTLLLFFLSTLNNSNFFWDYYLDGIQFILLFLIILIFSLNESYSFLIIKLFFISVFFITNILSFLPQLKKTEIPQLGLRADIKTVRYLLDNNKKQFCMRVYTPPIFPYTYQYLLGYFSKIENRMYPVDKYVDNKCWYIVDKENYPERVVKWREINTPKNAKLTKTKKMSNGTNIELWQIPQN